MNYPAMSKQPHRAVKIPALDGGVNYTDMPYAVQDNQLTECKNMWWHNGALRTRPGTGTMTIDYRSKSIGKEIATRTFIHNGGQKLSEQETALTYIGEKADEKTVFYADSFMDDRENSWEVLGFKELEVEEGTTALLARRGDTYYAYMSDGRVLETTGYFNEWHDAEPYIPLIMMNGKGGMDESGEPATTFEGLNRLSEWSRYQYTTDGKSSTFQLPVTDFEGIHVSLLLQHHKDEGEPKQVGVTFGKDPKNDVAVGEVTVDPDLFGIKYDDLGNEDVIECVLCCAANFKTGLLTFYAKIIRNPDNGDTIPNLAIPRVCANNLELWVQKTDAASKQKITAMTQSIWFGGDRGGVNGGSRLFVAGNPSDKALVCWSDLNNPLYFPENNFAYVGDPSQAVTGFGKQEDRLIIFKEREIYSVEYVAGNYTQEDLAAGRVVDVTAVSATFPVTPVHSTIGCDCPGTIRLVNNKLVWLCSNGHVYTLPTINQYSETNVRDISLLVQRELQKHTVEELKAAVAGEYMGYYLLAVGNRIYMMNAECSAFASVNYYSSKERAQRAIPWYVWDIAGVDTRILGMVVSSGILCIAQESDLIVDLNDATDNGEPIPCSFTTKAFDFGEDDKRKAVTQLYLGATAASPLKMRLSYITDRFTAEDAAILEGEGDPENMTAETYKVYRVTPNVHRVGVFGLRVDCNGAMAVTGLTIKYKNEGVTR